MALSKCLVCRQKFDRSVTHCPKDGSPLTPIASESDMEGKELDGRYNILKLVGKGAMGQVYKAQQIAMDRIVAIKVLDKKYTASENVVKRFQNEAKAASLLKSPHIISVYDFGFTEDKTPYIVTDFLEGTDLDALIDERGKLSIETALSIAAQVCDGIADAHDKGVLHRDIKPSNIMLIPMHDQSYFVKIVDFGIAKLHIEEGDTKLTQTGEIFGSPVFMSPEQCQGIEVTAASDIYSIGCSLFKSITGYVPFTGKDFMEVFQNHISLPAPKLNEVNPECNAPPELERIVRKTLEKKPEDRYKSVNDLKTDIDNLSTKITGTSTSTTNSALMELTRKVSVEDISEEPTLNSNNDMVTDALITVFKSLDNEIDRLNRMSRPKDAERYRRFRSNVASLVKDWKAVLNTKDN